MAYFWLTALFVGLFSGGLVSERANYRDEFCITGKRQQLNVAWVIVIFYLKLLPHGNKHIYESVCAGDFKRDDNVKLLKENREVMFFVYCTATLNINIYFKRKILSLTLSDYILDIGTWTFIT